MAMPKSGPISPIPPTHKPLKSHNAIGIEAKAALVVADEEWLREVLRRAGLICPEMMETAAREGRARLAAARSGGEALRRFHG